MAYLYADEQFPKRVVEYLRSFGHDVLTVQEVQNQGLSDPEVLAFAISQRRTVLTLNRRDFVRLHQIQPHHFGIIVCSRNDDRLSQANQINLAISLGEPLIGKLIRVYRAGDPLIE